MKKRIIGIDVARALAVIGMIIVNFKIVIGHKGEGWMSSFASLFDGKAAATFVVLAGIGLSLMTRSAIKSKNKENLKKSKNRIFKRAIFLFFIGLSYTWIWPADILHYYGIYMFVSLYFMGRHVSHIILGIIGLIGIYPLLLLIFPYEQGWNFTTLDYFDFWTLKGFFRNLLYNGFHPVIPWSSFMLFGLWYGNKDLNNNDFLKKSLRISIIIFIIVQLISWVAIENFSGGDMSAKEEISYLFGTAPMPPMPLYMLNGMSISVVIISSCILLAKKFENNVLITLFYNTGKLALTFYVAHVIIGMGVLEVFSTTQLGEYSICFSLSYALLFSALCVLFAQVWLKFNKSGPLEWIMRKITG